MALWDIALEKVKEKEDNSSSSSSQQSHVLFLGAKSSGKTTIINRFLDKDEAVKPTVALEYSFGRRSKGHSAKDVCHAWELGGGLSMARLLDGTLDEDNILNASVVIVVDLSNPATIWATVEGLINALLECIGRVIANAPREKRIKELLRVGQKERLKVLEKYKKQRGKITYTAGDTQLMEPFPLPLTLIGGKFDIFQEKVDLERRKTAASTLRFLAHRHYASLYFFSSGRQEQAVAKLKAHLIQLAFGGHSDAEDYMADLTKPLIISAGRDSFAKIGAAPVGSGDFNRLAAKTPMDLWKYSFYTHFPEEKHSKPLGPPADPTVDPNDSHKFDEAAVDKAKVAKDEELDKYKRISDRKMRDLMQQAVNEGITVNLPRHQS